MKIIKKVRKVKAISARTKNKLKKKKTVSPTYKARKEAERKKADLKAWANWNIKCRRERVRRYDKFTSTWVYKLPLTRGIVVEKIVALEVRNVIDQLGAEVLG